MKNIIFNYGDSQGEVFDYVFFNDESYIKYADDNRVGWRSGWSVRGLLKNEHQIRLFEPLDEIIENNRNNRDNIFIFLTFGSVDIEWNLSYKRNILKENIDTCKFIDEMISIFDKVLEKYLQKKILAKQKGINIFIILCFPFIPLPLSKNYMKNFSEKTNTEYYDVIDYGERCKLWNIYCDKMIDLVNCKYKHLIYIIDVRESFTNNDYKNYLTQQEDHHPDMSKTQYLIIDRLNNIVFNNFDDVSIQLKCNNWKDHCMYHHIRRPLYNTIIIK